MCSKNTAPIFLRTSRIQLRELTLEDEDNLLELDSDSEVMKYLTLGRPSTREEIVKSLSRIRNLFKKHQGRFGVWAAELRESSEFLGWFHFRPGWHDPDNTNRIELGYRLKQKYWGKGLATEGSLELIRNGFTQQQVEEVFALTLKDNLASRKVMEKVGLKFQRSQSLTFWTSNTVSTKPAGSLNSLNSFNFIDLTVGLDFKVFSIERYGELTLVNNYWFEMIHFYRRLSFSFMFLSISISFGANPQLGKRKN